MSIFANGAVRLTELAKMLMSTKPSCETCG